MNVIYSLEWHKNVIAVFNNIKRGSWSRLDIVNVKLFVLIIELDVFAVIIYTIDRPSVLAVGWSSRVKLVNIPSVSNKYVNIGICSFNFNMTEHAAST